jgi:hypothetical protein
VKGATPAAYNGVFTITATPSSTQFSYVALSIPPGPTTIQPIYTVLYPVASDYMLFLPNTAWDANFRWQMLGPLSAQEWGVLQYGITPVGPRLRYQIRGNLIFVQPPPGSIQTDLVGFTYVSNAWCQSALGVNQPLWVQDTDTYRLDEDTFILGLQWRFKRAKGFFYDDLRQDYQAEVDTVMGRDGGARQLPLDNVAEDITLLSDANVPDTGFGATS